MNHDVKSGIENIFISSINISSLPCVLIYSLTQSGRIIHKLWHENEANILQFITVIIFFLNLCI